MKNTICLTLLGLIAAGGLFAQDLTSITIGTNPSVVPNTANSPIFIVDGTLYANTQLFLWPVGSKHIVQFQFSVDPNGNPLPYQNSANSDVQFIFGGWVASNPQLVSGATSTITVTADPSLTSLLANISFKYLVNINFPSGSATNNTNCNGSPSNAPQDGFRAGIVYLDGTCYGDSATLFMPAGPHTLTAFPYPGWVFYGFSVNANQISTPLATINITGPTMIVPQFSIAKRVNFLSNPPGLNVLVDGATIYTPAPPLPSSDGASCAPDYSRLPPGAPAGFTPLCFGQFDFMPGSVHTLGAPTPQTDKAGNTWAFSGFSNGLGQNSKYTAPMTINTPDTITANFVPATRVTILTNPGGLKVMVDGRDNWLNDNFDWGQGETHQVTAESPVTDKNGRAWQFVSWSDKGAASHSITVPANSNQMAITATYAKLEQATIVTSPSGQSISVDGQACMTPCAINRANGATAQVTIPASAASTPGSEYKFAGWSDGVAGTSRQITFSQDSLVLSASYQVAYFLAAVTDPANAGTFATVPPSSDGYFPAGTQVSITVAANGGFKFVKWEGDIAGYAYNGVLTMNGPHVVQADFLPVPYIPPAGIQSAAGPTPDGSVAPGSLAVIYGQNLAPAFQLGPANPLALAIATTTVTVGNTSLPLVYVSPTQIAAQIPWEFADGPYTLVVHTTGQSDVSGNFTVSRDAPAVFTQTNALNLPLVLATHPDGT
ncbi:MAG: InlB B-repeat-containing protein, partial [Bryobacteraceae bacterium]